MNKLLSTALVCMLTLGALAARAADDGTEERSELRQRAEELQAQRARNPDFQPGEGRLSPEQRADAPARSQKPHAKRGSQKQANTAKTGTRRERTAKRVRSLKKLPGALVRDR